MSRCSKGPASCGFASKDACTGARSTGARYRSPTSSFMHITTSGARDSMRSWTTRGARAVQESEPVMNDSAPRVLVERLDPEALRRFMCPAPGARVTRAECDPRVGGKFLIVMNVGGQDLPHRGEYVEIERYTRMEFTWVSAHAGEGSRVTLRFAESPGGQTKLMLEHVGLADAEIRSRHHSGWSNILAELSALVGLVA